MTIDTAVMIGGMVLGGAGGWVARGAYIRVRVITARLRRGGMVD